MVMPKKKHFEYHLKLLQQNLLKNRLKRWKDWKMEGSETDDPQQKICSHHEFYPVLDLVIV
jgi:hypothetical protein